MAVLTNAAGEVIIQLNNKLQAVSPDLLKYTNVYLNKYVKQANKQEIYGSGDAKAYAQAIEETKANIEIEKKAKEKEASSSNP